MRNLVIIALIITIGSLGYLAYGNNDQVCQPVMLGNNTCLMELERQNNIIIEKLDWNNCALSHKAASSYSHIGDNWRKTTAFTSEELVEFCGIRP